jgi:luciferase family oxidoreductase group 1
MTLLSVLDLAPVPEGSDPAAAFAHSLDLARHAEGWGYHRFWLAEHHNMPGIASAATAVVIGHVAAGTRTIRVGAGGIMLPNHAPLMVAEQFGTLATLFPGRIDLGLGRAPGTDPVTAQALRRNLAGSVEDFPRDVVELMHYFRAVQPGQRVQAVPGAGLDMPIWILGSSLFGAQLAAMLGLPFAFASHFAPAELDRALAVYRSQFQPSDQLERPYVMVAMNVFAADSEDEARFLFSSLQQAFVNLRTGRPGLLPAPDADYDRRLDPAFRAMLDQVLSCSVVGEVGAVERAMAAFTARTGADEIIVTAQIHDHAARLHSFELTARAHAAIAARGGE